MGSQFVYSSCMATSKGNRDIIVRCRGGGHAVRLAGGRRFFRSARCPTCRSAVDPTRGRRILRWAANLRQPASRWWVHQALWWATLAFLGLALGAVLVLWGFGDTWWPATVLLFGPRWVLLLPLVVLFPSAVILDRSLAVALTMGGLLILGPVLGLRVGLRAWLPGGGDGPELRIITFNARGGSGLARTGAELLVEWAPDILAVQECGGELRSELNRLPSWHVDARSGVCLASRFPIQAVSVMEREALESAGGSGVVVTYVLDIGERTVSLTNLHLETPRAGFELVRAGRLREGIPKVDEKSFLRGIELDRASRWVDTIRGPQIVVGDFNTPPESRLFRSAWAEWQNAFSVAGRGLGGTRLNGWIRARIDHVLANRDWRVDKAWLEDDVGSDHLALAAELRLRSRRWQRPH